MNFEYFIADRMSRSAEGGRPNIMVRIATFSVAAGIAAMIVTLAVLAGFEHEIERRITGFTGHVLVADTRGFEASEPPVFERDSRAEELLAGIGGFVSMSPYALRCGIVKSEDSVEGLVLKGYDDGAGFFAECLVEGSMPRMCDSVLHKEILISRVVADRLQIEVGKRIEMLFVDGARPARRDRFVVSGIYASGMDESDKMLVLTDIRNVRRLIAGSTDRTVSGYEVRIDDFDRAEEFADEANRLLLYDDDVEAPVAAMSIRDLQAVIFDWQKTHDVNAVVIIILMLTVALFNTVSALLILVLERTRTIGVLKSMGMSDSSLRKVFLYRAVFIVVKGIVWGDIAGAALCLLQKYTHIIKLDPAGYILSEMPVRIEWWHLPVLDAGAVAVIVLGLLIPARIVASIRPEEAVRYE